MLLFLLNKIKPNGRFLCCFGENGNWLDYFLIKTETVSCFPYVPKYPREPYLLRLWPAKKSAPTKLNRVLRTMSTYSSSKSYLTCVTFHLLDTVSIKSSTVNVKSTMASCLYPELWDSCQWSNNLFTLYVCTIPNLVNQTFLEKLSSMLNAASGICQPYANTTFQKGGSWIIHVPSYTLRAKRDSGFFHTLQAWFASNAWLNFSISRKPKPSNSLSFHSFLKKRNPSNLWYLLLVVPVLHQNSMIALVNSAQTSFGNLKQDIENTRRARAI